MSLGFHKDTDSISTFRSTKSSLKKKGKNSAGTIKTFLSTPTQSVTFAPINLDKPDDTSLSCMSDTASKVAGLELQFENMESQFSESFARLEAILSGLGTNRLSANVSGSTGSKNNPVQLANLPVSVNAGGFTNSKAASNCS
jgi:hypothetical protein